MANCLLACGCIGSCPRRLVRSLPFSWRDASSAARSTVSACPSAAVRAASGGRKVHSSGCMVQVSANSPVFCRSSSGSVPKGFGMLVTTGTVTSGGLAEQRLQRGVIHQFIPLDISRFVRRFLQHWRPDLALFVESELWPNMMIEASTRGIPMVLINARLSGKFISALAPRTTFDRRFAPASRSLFGRHFVRRLPVNRSWRIERGHDRQSEA